MGARALEQSGDKNKKRLENIFSFVENSIN
jgi:hypothetical protein